MAFRPLALRSTQGGKTKQARGFTPEPGWGRYSAGGADQQRRRRQAREVRVLVRQQSQSFMTMFIMLIVSVIFDWESRPASLFALTAPGNILAARDRTR